jgi:hypothetical protein
MSTRLTENALKWRAQSDLKRDELAQDRDALKANPGDPVLKVILKRTEQQHIRCYNAEHISDEANSIAGLIGSAASAMQWFQTEFDALFDDIDSDTAGLVVDVLRDRFHELNGAYRAFLALAEKRSQSGAASEHDTEVTSSSSRRKRTHR